LNRTRSNAAEDALRAVNWVIGRGEQIGIKRNMCEHIAQIGGIEILEQFATSCNCEVKRTARAIGLMGD
jgi:hypothetical protein